MVEAIGPAKIAVAESGNRRQGISDEDIEQCIKDIAEWLQTNASKHYNERMAPVANKNEVAGVNVLGLLQ